MKKGIKISIIALCLIIVSLIAYIVIDKFVITKDKTESSNVIDIDNESSNTKKEIKDVKALIKAEIDKKEFLNDYNIKESELWLLKYGIVETGNNPIYIVVTCYQKIDEPGHGKIFQVIYNNDKVVFDEIEDHKYTSDIIEFDSNNKNLKLSAEYHGGIRESYFKLENDRFVGVDDVNSNNANYSEVKLYNLDYDNKSTELSEEAIIKNAFKNNLSSNKNFVEYKINNVKVYNNEQKQEIINLYKDNNYLINDSFAEIDYDVKMAEGIGVAGNGDYDENTRWCKGKIAFVTVRNGKIISNSTSW